METQNVNVFFYNLSIETELIQSMANSVSDEQINYHFNDHDLSKINLLLRNDPYAVFIFKVESREDFVKTMAFLKTKKKLIRKGYLRPICLLGIENKKIERLLERESCTLLLQNNLNQKIFNLKSKMAIRSLLVMLNQDQLKDMELIKRDHLDNSKKLNSFNKEFNELVDTTENQNNSNIINFNLKRNKLPKFNAIDYKNEFVDFVENSEKLGKLPLDEGKLKIRINELERSDLYYSFDHFEKESITLEAHGVHQLNCTDKISVFVEFIFNKCRVEIELEGQIGNIEVITTENTFITVQLDNLETEKFDYFMELYQKRQKNINDFMELAKGY